MDESDLRDIAVRLAQEDRKDRKKDEGPEAGADPNWQKVQNMVNTSVKSTFLDLKQAIKDEDPKLTVYHMERMLEAVTQVAKFMGMRDVFLKLKSLEQKLFD